MTGNTMAAKGSAKRQDDTQQQTSPLMQPDASQTLTKLIWLFVIGCVAGFVLESAYSLLTKGYIESRKGMIYGPFNQVYGFGVVAMVVMLTPLATKTRGRLFLGSAVIGGVFEFVCSWLQERVIGTVSWDYTAEPFSIGGRTTLVFMVYWGIGGLLLMRLIYPRVSALIDRIPQRTSHVLSRITACVLAVNMLLSLAAVIRWHERGRGEAPAGAVDVFLDEHYDDDMLARIYPNMRVVQ